MAATSVSARFQELFPETNLISLLTKYGGDADDIFEAIQDRYDAHEQGASRRLSRHQSREYRRLCPRRLLGFRQRHPRQVSLFPSPQRSRRHRRRSRSRRPHHASRK